MIDMQLELLVTFVLLRFKSARSSPETDHSRMLSVTMKPTHILKWFYGKDMG